MRYLLTKELMIENGYPMPSYLAETFEKPAGWVETKVTAVDDLLSTSPEETPRIYAMDCEMVRCRLHRPFSVAHNTSVYDGGGQATRSCMPYRICVRNRDIRPARETRKARRGLSDTVHTSSFLSAVRSLTAFVDGPVSLRKGLAKPPLPSRRSKLTSSLYSPRRLRPSSSGTRSSPI